MQSSSENDTSGHGVAVVDELHRFLSSDDLVRASSAGVLVKGGGLHDKENVKNANVRRTADEKQATPSLQQQAQGEAIGENDKQSAGEGFYFYESFSNVTFDEQA